EDTIQQMSRWLGYRGPHLEFCRLFTSEAMYQHLRQMHENDVDLREQLAELMAKRTAVDEASLILRANPRALPTGKIGDATVVDLAYSPYTNVLSFVECDAYGEQNEKAALGLVEAIRSRKPEEVVNLVGAKRGILSRGWMVEEVAAILDSL